MANEPMLGGLSPERAPSSGADLATLLDDCVQDLHTLRDGAKIASRGAQAAERLFEGTRGLLQIEEDGQERRVPIGSTDPGEFEGPQFRHCAKAAMNTGNFVSDGVDEKRVLVVPVRAGNAAPVGFFIVASGRLEQTLGMPRVTHFFGRLAKHVGVALENARVVSGLNDDIEKLREGAVPTGLSLKDSRLRFERQLIEDRLGEAFGNIAQAARSLEMDRGQLSRLLKKHGIDKNEYRGAPGVRRPLVPLG